MNYIVEIIKTYKEDHPEVIITDDMIKGIIIESIDKLIEEIKERLNNL